MLTRVFRVTVFPPLQVLPKCLLAGLAALFVASVASAVTLGTVTASGYTFTNFDFPNAGTNAAAGSNSDGIANNGAAVGFAIDNNGNFINSVRNPDGTFTAPNLTGFQPMAFGINSAGDIVGQQNGAAFFLPHGGSAQTLATPTGVATAFGINDHGNIVGQFTLPNATPGFYMTSSAGNGLIQIKAPLGSGTNVVNAQGINDNGLVVGFYLGNNGQAHGFDANIQNASGGLLTGTAIPDPTIPNVPPEPGATFVFSEILGINDSGIAVGYYGDSTASLHCFLYNTNTGAYTFLDDPSEAFNNGVEDTQITGITDSDEITGFYSDANGVFHGFVACPAGMTCPGASAAPEPASPLLVALGFGLFGFSYLCRRRKL